MPRLRNVLALLSVAVSSDALAAGQDLNVISAVGVKDAGDSVVLTIEGSRPPNFTTFSMADPPRFVLDLSEAKFQGVPEDLPVKDALILAVKNLSYGSDATSIARVMIAFHADVDPPEVQAQGASLVVRIAKPAGMGAAVARTDPVPDRAREEAEAARAAQEEADREKLRAEREALARQEIERLAREEAAARAPERAPAPESGGSEPAAPQEDTARDEAAAAAQAEGGSQEEDRRAEARRQRDEAMAAARAEAVQRKLEAAERRAEAKRQREEAIAAARDAAERRKLEAAERRAEAKRRREDAIAAVRDAAERRKLEAAERREEARRRRAEEKREREEARLARAREAELDAGAPSAQLREIGFRQLPGVSRVFVRTSVPARFTIQDVGENVIRVELENTRVVRRNDARFLDTSFFPSVVAMITPARRGASYVVDIRLREKVPYQQRIEGDMLAIDFERPGATAPDAAPAASADPAAALGEAAGLEPSALDEPAAAGPAAAPER